MGNGLVLRNLVVQGDSAATLLCRTMLVKRECFLIYGLHWDSGRQGQLLKNAPTSSLFNGDLFGNE